MRSSLLLVLFLMLAALAACGQSTPNVSQTRQTAGALLPTLQAGAQSAGQTAVTLATENPVDLDAVKQTAVALATKNPVDVQSAQQTAQAMVPTLQAQAPELRATAEALATLIPSKGGPALATMEAMIRGGEIPEDVPIAEPANIILQGKTHIIYTTTKLPVEVVQFYQTEMANFDWKLQPNSATTESGGRLGFEKGNRKVTITVVRTGEATTVDLALSE